jgi:predicted metal-dependent phosphoesterase TrpH
MKNMTFAVDLHTHTYYSDGRASPEELITYAAQIGVKTLAITDHDNTRGTREGAAVAQRLGIELIPAMELTARWDELLISLIPMIQGCALLSRRAWMSCMHSWRMPAGG